MDMSAGSFLILNAVRVRDGAAVFAQADAEQPPGHPGADPGGEGGPLDRARGSVRYRAEDAEHHEDAGRDEIRAQAATRDPEGPQPGHGAGGDAGAHHRQRQPDHQAVDRLPLAGVQEQSAESAREREQENQTPAQGQ
jgi:hypothetical protein